MHEKTLIDTDRSHFEGERVRTPFPVFKNAKIAPNCRILRIQSQIFFCGAIPPGSPQCLYPDTNFRLARERFHCSCITKRPPIQVYMYVCSLQDNSPTNQLAVSQVADWSTRRQRIFKNHGITILYLHIKPNPDPNSNPIEYWQRINSVICLKQHLELLYTPNFKSNISAS